AAVTALNGTHREGQTTMAEAVGEAVDRREHLVVQAGTGTGKSLAYLVPAIRHAMAEKTTVVVSTATIALQNQLIDRDLPRLAEALSPLLFREPTFAVLKGRRNYLCRNRLQTAGEEAEDTELFDPRQLSSLGRQFAVRPTPTVLPGTTGQPLARVGGGDRHRGPGRTRPGRQ